MKHLLRKPFLLGLFLGLAVISSYALLSTVYYQGPAFRLHGF